MGEVIFNPNGGTYSSGYDDGLADGIAQGRREIREETKKEIESEWIAKGWDNHHSSKDCPHCRASDLSPQIKQYQEEARAQGRRDSAEAYCDHICAMLSCRHTGKDKLACGIRNHILGTTSDDDPKAKEHSEYFGGESALSVACEIFNKLHLENESIVYWIKIEIENWYKEKAKNERAQGRREGADIAVDFLNSWAPKPRSHDEVMAALRKAILGTASDPAPKAKE